MVAPVPEQVLKNLTEVKQVRVCLFTDFDRNSFLLKSFCKLSNSDELQNSALVRFLSKLDSAFGVMRDVEGTILAHVTAGVMLKDKGYILYLKLNDVTKMVDVYSVGDDFLSFLTQQHSWIINNPALLAMSWSDVVDKDKFIYDLDVYHQFSPSVRRSETALEVRLTAFNTEVDFGSVTYKNGSIDFYPTGEDIKVTELDPVHVFGAKWFNENIKNNKPVKSNIVAETNALLMVGHGGVGIVHCYDDNKLYVVNKIITKSMMSTN